MTQPHWEQYQKQLTQITRKLRRTVDRDTIWQQAVDGIGEVLGIGRCIICPYINFNSQVPVVAEYRQQSFASMLGQLIPVVDNNDLLQALNTLEPIVVEQISASDRSQRQSVLVVATSYQDQPNGLISTYQGDLTREWTEGEIEFVREIADQVGCAIAHAALHQELEETRQQAQEAIRLKKEFLGTISHELRTPLNGMIGFLKLILDDMVAEPDEQREFTQEAYGSALRLFNIINDILDLAKIEANQIEIELGPVSLNNLLGDVEDYTRTQVEQKNLSLYIHPPATYDEIILYGNYQRLLQVMLNLVGNAIKFTDEGGITISTKLIKQKVSVCNQELPGLLKVRIDDTGIGVPLEKLDKLFGIFTKGDGSRTCRYGGTGLGLTISKKLVEAMGGEINFFSMGEGLGSTVTFTVPLYQEPVTVSKQQSDRIKLLTSASSLIKRLN